MRIGTVLAITAIAGLTKLSAVAKGENVGGLLDYPPSCFGNETLNLWLEGRCEYEDLVERMNIEVKRTPSCSNEGYMEVWLLLGIELSQDPCPEYAMEANEFASRDKIREICENAAFQEATNDYYAWKDVLQRGSQFDKQYFDGNTILNEEYQTSVENRVPYIPGVANNLLGVDGHLIDDTYEAVAEVQGIEFPQYISNFENCDLRAAMCCWVSDRQAGDNNGNCNEPYDTDCTNADPADNTDICFVDFRRTLPDSHHLPSDTIGGGFALYDGDNNDGEGATHCHGFAWGNDFADPIARYRGNNLLYVSLSDHLYDRGYTRNVPGAPMCACLENMPVATRSDCTQLDVEEIWIFSFNPTPEGGRAVSVRLDPERGIRIDFNSCQGARRNNDLESYYERLRNEGLANDEELNEVRKILVGNGRCPQARDAFLETMGFEPLEEGESATA